MKSHSRYAKKLNREQECMPEMFGTEFVAFALVIFTIIAVTTRLGMFDSVIRSHGTQLSSVKTKSWLVFLTVIFVSIIMGLGLLAENFLFNE